MTQIATLMLLLGLTRHGLDTDPAVCSRLSQCLSNEETAGQLYHDFIETPGKRPTRGTWTMSENDRAESSRHFQEL